MSHSYSGEKKMLFEIINSLNAQLRPFPQTICCGYFLIYLFLVV